MHVIIMHSPGAFSNKIHIGLVGLTVSIHNVLTGVAAYNVVLVVLAFLEYPVSTVVTIEFAVRRCA